MAAVPRDEEFSELDEFLRNCEWAAEPPSSNPLLVAVLSSGPHQARKFGDVGTMRSGRIASEDLLPATRADRIAKLKEWMELFPAHCWLRNQPLIVSALESFRRIQARRRDIQRLNNDTADFRFWYCATWAAVMRDLKPQPSPDYEQRRRAAGLALELCNLLKATRLLNDLGMDWHQQRQLLASLDTVQTIKRVDRKTRFDSSTADREAVKLLTRICYTSFSCAPPTLIAWLACFKVRNPDKIAINKLVSATVRELQKETR